MIEPARGKAKRSLQVFGFEIRHFFQNLFSRQSCCEQIEHVADANAHSANARTSSALLGIFVDSFNNHGHEKSIAVLTRSAASPRSPDSPGPRSAQRCPIRLSTTNARAAPSCAR